MPPKVIFFDGSTPRFIKSQEPQNGGTYPYFVETIALEVFKRIAYWRVVPVPFKLVVHAMAPMPCRPSIHRQPGVLAEA